MRGVGGGSVFDRDQPLVCVCVRVSVYIST